MNQERDLTDLDLLSAFRGGDELAYKHIYDRYWQLLFRFSRKLLQDDSLAKDVVQEVFTALWEKKGNFAIHIYSFIRLKSNFT